MRILTWRVEDALRSISKSLGAWSGGGFAKVLLHPSDAAAILEDYPVEPAPVRTKLVIYLAGPIAGCDDKQAHMWRDYVIANLGQKYDFRNPMVRDYRGDDTTPAAEIVEGDIEDIRASDIVLSYCWQRSYGTIMEIVYAHQFKKRAVVVCPDKFYSPWLKFHASELHHTLSEAVAALHE